MSKPTQSIATVVAGLFPKSQKAVSEKMSTDEFNAFSADAQEIQDRLDAQASGNEALKADLLVANTSLTTAQARVTELESQLTTAQEATGKADTKATDLQTKLTASESEVTRLKASINPLSESDESNKADASAEFLTDTDKIARGISLS